ncbi:hypothetical protein [Burkholderia sp. RF4-BP95]|uniref:hypothetical protein n=1 Tax=Burkholderia sp. RF4-BP95 TaxID=1637845 RepID=UPI0012E34297|nr:hypothetical protein [Burkholderia sp. RF4-BP95]
MSTHDFSEFPSDEQEDALQVINQAKLDPREFKITDNEDYPAGGRIGAIRRQVTVTRITNDTVRIYEAGDRTTWVADIGSDIKAGAFSD